MLKFPCYGNHGYFIDTIIVKKFDNFSMPEQKNSNDRIFLFAGHYMDQKRLKQGLYRHPWDDISYVLPEQYN